MSVYHNITFITTKRGLIEISHLDVFLAFARFENILYLKDDLYCVRLDEINKFDAPGDFLDILRDQEVFEFVSINEDLECCHVCSGIRYLHIKSNNDDSCRWCEVDLPDGYRNLTNEEVSDFDLSI